MSKINILLHRIPFISHPQNPMITFSSHHLIFFIHFLILSHLLKSVIVQQQCRSKKCCFSVVNASSNLVKPSPFWERFQPVVNAPVVAWHRIWRAIPGNHATNITTFMICLIIDCPVSNLQNINHIQQKDHTLPLKSVSRIVNILPPKPL